MHAHHRYELTNRLERLSATGAVRIERDELLTWYDQVRLSKAIWRDIKSRWQEIEGEKKNIDILIWEGDGFVQFLYPTGFISIDKKL